MTDQMADLHRPVTFDVVVVGRANIDINVRIPQRPISGRTTFASSPAATTAGGKSLNQVMAAARAGARTSLISNAGADEWGEFLKRTLAETAVDVSCFQLLPSTQTGIAIVEVMPDGDNHIILAVPPATELTDRHIRTGLERLRSPVLVTQLDLQPEAVDAVLRHHQAQTLIGNLVPHPNIGPTAFAGLDVFVANEHEAAAILGRHHPDPTAAARELRKLGTRTAIVTAGPHGAAYSSPEETALVPAQQVVAIDTSGAGDAFLGTLAAQLAQGLPIREAVTAGVRAGTTAVQTVRQG